MAHDKQKFVLCGHYGSTNLGDEAIGLSIIESLYKKYPEAEIVVLSYDKARSREFYNKFIPQAKVKTFYLVPLGIRSFLRGIFKGELWHTLKQIKTCDKFILGGGGLFTDERLFAVLLWGLQAYFAYKYKKPVYMLGQSVGPIKTKIGRWIVKRVFSKAFYINLRDEESKNLLEKLKINKEIIVTCDPVFKLNFDRKFIQKSGYDRLNKKVEQLGCCGYFICSIRPWIENQEKLYTKFIQTVDEIRIKYQLLPVFIPFQLIKDNDWSVLNKFIAQKGLEGKIKMLKYNENIYEILDIISHAKFTFGMRLHSILFSILAGCPFIAISYSEKIQNFLKMAGLENYIIKSFDKNEIFPLVDQIIQEYCSLNLKLKEKSYILAQKWNKFFL
ncbi:polysaccharide pyruvyl transferase family protein [Candidatus Peregrinibacteria bacterium]|nr:polysaccharide pyruvyl transferase family protein [Candidatus Peregrinibacteria bacterium]